MQICREYTFKLDEEDDLSICSLTTYVNLSDAGAGPEQLNVEFMPCHLPALRELVLKLEAVQALQRQREEAPA